MSNPKDEGPLFDPLNLDDAFAAMEPSPSGSGSAKPESSAAPDPFASDPFAEAGIPSEPSADAAAEAVAPLGAPGDAKAGKKKKKEKAPKPVRERKPKAAKPRTPAGAPLLDVYGWMLCISLLAIVLAVAFLWVELHRYNYDFKAEEGKRVAQASGVESPAGDWMLA